jgi:hypothetical protein
MSDSRQESPQKCPKCSNTENLTVAVTSVPDRESTWGGRVVWDNNTATTCGACGFIGKVADFEPKDSYGPEHEEARQRKGSVNCGRSAVQPCGLSCFGE